MCGVFALLLTASPGSEGKGIDSLRLRSASKKGICAALGSENALSVTRTVPLQQQLLL